MAGPAKSAECLDVNEQLLGNMVEEAVAYCAGKTATGSDRAVAGLQAGDPAVAGYFAHSLAVQAGRLLGSADPTVTAVYRFRFSADERGILPISLILRVERETEALWSLAEGIGTGLAHACRARLGSALTGTMSDLLDVHVVTEEQAARRVGIGAAIGSLWDPAVSVWERGNE